MPHPAFELLQSQTIPALHVTAHTYRHRVTGAQHLHLEAADPHNAFLVAFLTVPEDDTGVAHILEHTALCGSERYPVRDPFFMMLRRSLQTFMNAITSSDWTAYPFASQCRKDYFNLLDVYLDAAFFPRLDALDFAQEGWRVEWAEAGNPESELLFKGVVFNEMKGAMSAPPRVLWQALSAKMFPETTYRHNSGGDPEAIPNLTWEGLKSFHARHYHPSNAVFMTYGDLPVEALQERFERQALHRFQAIPIDWKVPDETRLTAPVTTTGRYAIAPNESPEEKTHIVLGWLWGSSVELKTLLLGHLLEGVLMDNSSSPLLLALETTELGGAPSPIGGLDDSMKEMLFVCGVEGSEPERAEAVEELVMGVIRRVAEEGVEPERVEAVLHQLELAQREVGGDGYPYGLKLMMNALPAALHGGDPASLLALDPVLDELRREIADPDMIKGLARRWLLDNPHRVRLVLTPDAHLPQEQQAREKAQLAQLRAALSQAEKERVATLAEALAQRQTAEDDPEILPKVGREDIPAELAIPVGGERALGATPCHWFDQPTNGLVYQQAVLDLPELDDAERELLPLFSACLTEVGCGGRDYLATQAWQSAVTGGVHARATVRGSVEALQGARGVFVVSGKALARNHAPLTQLLRETLFTARFDETNRLRELITQMRAASESRVTDHGHSLVLSAASAGLTPAAALSDRWGGLSAIQRLKSLDAALGDPAALAQLAERMEGLRQKLAVAPRRLVVVGEERFFAEWEKALADQWDGQAPAARLDQPPMGFAPLGEGRPTRQGWSAASNVQFCAKVYPAVPYLHPDAPRLTVLGQLLKNGYLHRAIREQGGAYGSGAGYDGDSGSFRFFSYRDPRLSETLDDFSASLAWLQAGGQEERQLEEAVLGVISAIDRPASPAGEAKRAFHDRLHGRTPERRRAYRQQVLSVTLDELRQVAARLLLEERANIAVLGPAAALDQHPELGLERYAL
ncbi:MAG: insulinase family protein [Magnetococcales bacterium]|nr:insulinase family protein [Magnetococcales bacterium]